MGRRGGKGKGRKRNGRGEEGRGRKGEGRGRGEGGRKDCPPSLYMLKVALFLAECKKLHAVTELSTSNAVKQRQ
jgi:hypothetical protein